MKGIHGLLILLLMFAGMCLADGDAGDDCEEEEECTEITEPCCGTISSLASTAGASEFKSKVCSYHFGKSPPLDTLETFSCSSVMGLGAK